MKAYCADKIFTGDEMLPHHAVIVNDGVVTGILPQVSLDKNIPAIHIPQPYIVPSFIDVQIYGAGGKLFSVHPTADALHELYHYCKLGGAFNFMPTVATNTYDVIHRCIDGVREYWQQGGKGCLGLHVEGPWINPVKRGAHIESLIHAPTVEQVGSLLEYGKDVIRIITLAPEVCSKEVLEIIDAYDIIISAGHSNATFSQATQAFNKGINTVTHLYNAMSGLQHREAGLVGAAFLHKTVMASIVADGYHVDYAAIKIAYQQMKGRLFAITDAVTSTTEGHYPHELVGDRYMSSNILSGSALTMGKALQNLVTYAGIDLQEALRMVSYYPAKLLGINHNNGIIEKGHKANFIALDDKLNVHEVLEAE